MPRIPLPNVVTTPFVVVPANTSVRRSDHDVSNGNGPSVNRAWMPNGVSQYRQAREENMHPMRLVIQNEWRV